MTQFAIPTQAELVRQIDSFLLRHDMKPSRLSREATGEPSLVETIRKGRSPKLATVEKLMNFMARADAEAATQAKLTAPLDAPPPGEEIELPFQLAPVNPTGASPAISSSTSAPSSPSAANGCSRSTAADHAGAAPIRSSCEAERTHPHAAVARVPAAEGAGAGHVAPPCSGDPDGS